MAKRKFTEAKIISALEMVEAVYRDACAQCITDVADSRDLQTIRSRVKDQGLSFLTITLPNSSPFTHRASDASVSCRCTTWTTQLPRLLIVLKI